MNEETQNKDEALVNAKEVSRKGSNIMTGNTGQAILNHRKSEGSVQVIPKKEGSVQVIPKKEDPKNYPHSFADFVLLFLVGSLASGNGYIITCVQSFEPVLQSRYNYNAFTISTLNSIVSIPKIFTSFLEGYLLTKLGFIMAVAITATGLLGHTLYAIGIMFDSYPTSVAGRFIVGAEFNMMFTTQYLITVYYFGHRFIILANCVNYIFTILFCVIACYFNPILVNYFRDHLLYPLIISIIPAVFSFVTSIILWLLKRKNFGENERTDSDIKLEEQKFHIKYIKEMPAKFWVMLIQETAMLNSFMNFIYMGTYYGIARFNEHYMFSKDMPSLMNLMILPVLVALTVWSEQLGKRAAMLVFANCLNIGGAIWLLCMGTNDGGQYPIAVVVIGLSFGIYTSYSWPILSMTVGNPDLVTFGMTLCLVLESVVEFIVPLIVGYIDIPRDNAAYLKSTWIVFALGAVGLISSIVVFLMDYNGDKCLHNTPNEQKLQDKAEEADKLRKQEEEAKRILDFNDPATNLKDLDEKRANIVEQMEADKQEAMKKLEESNKLSKTPVPDTTPDQTGQDKTQPGYLLHDAN